MTRAWQAPCGKNRQCVPGYAGGCPVSSGISGSSLHLCGGQHGGKRRGKHRGACLEHHHLLDGEYYYFDATNGDQPEFLEGDAVQLAEHKTILYDYLCPFPEEYEMTYTRRPSEFPVTGMYGYC